MRKFFAAALLCCAPLSVTAQITTQLRGRAEFTAFVPQSSPAWLIPATDAFIAPRVSLFAELFAGEHIYLFGELRADRGAAPDDQTVSLRIEQLFARVTPTAAAALHLQAGRFISPFGNYPGRSHSSADPFIRPPLNYDYRTIMSASVVARAAAGWITWKDQPDQFRPRGAPIVWAVPYQLGAMAFGSLHGAEYRLAVMNSAPSSEPELWNKWFSDLPGPSLVGHLGYQLRPELRLGASFNRGPYLDPVLKDSLRDSIGDFDQQLIGFELTATRGRAELRAELLLDSWEVPRVPEEATDLSYYAEAKYKLGPGLAAALRYGRIDFNEPEFADADWDYDISRWQLGLMYNFTARIDARAEYMINRGGTRDPKDNLFSLQAALTF